MGAKMMAVDDVTEEVVVSKERFWWWRLVARMRLFFAPTFDELFDDEGLICLLKRLQIGNACQKYVPVVPWVFRIGLLVGEKMERQFCSWPWHACCFFLLFCGI